MTFVPTFTTGVIQPSNVAYRAVTISANYAPVWPSKAANTPEVVANLMEITATVAPLNITLPPANQVGNGTTVIWRNVGANTFTLVDQGGNTVLAITAGQVFAVYLQDDSTVNGTWASFQFSTTTSSATPGPLAGLGLVAITTTLNTAHPIVATAVNGYTTSAADRAELLTWTGGAGGITLQAVATAGNNFYFLLRNSGSGLLTVTPNGGDLIDGNATLTLNPTDSCFLICSGTAWNTVGIGRSTTATVTQLIIPVGGAANVTLTAAQANNQLLQFTGVLTGNIAVIVPTGVATYHVFNNTTGAFSLTVRTVAGTGVIVPQGLHAILDCDATNVVSADSVFTQATIIPCTATGTNAITLTPVSGTLLAYVDQQLFSFTPANTSTAAVTVLVSALAAGNLFLPNGTTPVNGSMVIAGQPMIVMRVNALAGFVVVAGAAPRQVRSLLGKSGLAVNTPADITEDILVEVNVAANAPGPNGAICGMLNISATNNANVKTIRMRFSGIGGTIVIPIGMGGAATTIIYFHMTNNNATNSQTWNAWGAGTGPALFYSPNVASAIDTTVATKITITGQKTVPGDALTLNSYLIEQVTDGT